MKFFVNLLDRYFLFLCIGVVLFACFVRIWQLDNLPPSLYWEEAALGYDAYSIVKTGKDHHGQPLPVVAFSSFGDYKPSGYFYAVVPFIALFGLNETAVRLPSALAGVLIVIGVGLLAQFLAQAIWLNQKKTFFGWVFLLGMIIAATSPWLIQFSRGGWEVNLASCLLLWSVVCGLWVEQSPTQGFSRLIKMFATAVLAVLSMYTYHATRIIAPAVFISLNMIWFSPALFEHLKRKLAIQQAVVVIFLFAVLVFPLLLSVGNPTTQQRFAETSLYADGQYVVQSNQFRELAGNSIGAKIFGHRYIYLASQTLSNFLTHFSVDFLFIHGDQNLRHSTGFTGILYFTDATWLSIGIIFLAAQTFKNKKLRMYILFLLWWLMIGIFPAAVTKAAPHALRILPTAPIFLFTITIGLTVSLLWLKKQKPKYVLWVGVITLLFVSSVQWWMYWRYYTKIYPILAASEWQYGYKQMVTRVNQYKVTHPDQPILITREYGRPAMYYWFFSQTDPRQVQAEENIAKKDQGEFLTFQNLHFINSVNEAAPGLVVCSADQFKQLQKQFSFVEKIGEVKDLRGQVVWVLAEVRN